MNDHKLNLSSSQVLKDVTIRKLEKADLPALEWDGEYLHFRNVFRSVYKRMQEGTVMAWVADLPEHGIIGQIFLQMDCDRPEMADGWNRAYFYSFRMKPPFRNLGIGSQMLKIVEDYITAKGFTRLTLNVARENVEAIRLYQRFGYQIVAEEPGIWSYMDHIGDWHTVKEPSWRMEKLLKANHD